MAWGDDLPRIKAENQAWRDKFLPKLREQQELKNARRAECADLLQRGLASINATDEQKALVFELTGFRA
ncbi:MAG: hypothetical protein CMN73_04445 [Sphingomonas sp.]|nr:hypothetical protein [Sphingomonas sp.]|tara:strand:- start:1716 stop:1922 length:207 start_codon:yes stop_codon:yes gene_type:complete